MKALILIIILALNVNPYALQSNLDPVINEYLKVKEALVKSNNQVAYASSQALLVVVEANPLSSPDLLRAAKKLADLKDLEKQRSEFAGFSSILWNMVKAYEYSGGTLYYQYCPMKKAYWLSEDAAIRNPYYGASMLKCGTIVDQIN